MPIIENIVDVETKKSREILKRIAKFGIYIANKQNHDILLVTHLSTSISTMKNLGIYNQIIFELYQIVCMSPKIHIGIENITNFHQDKKRFNLYDVFQDNDECSPT